ncbi:EamA family transporter [Methanococcus maripaludis]|uniref:Transporter family protein n=1 Tax=Methanococcus maripaludis TaxID=39152 RepID=A0A7J9P9H4_METMI|nr:EamA family transporter [Methanococcus maripaludis]MBA2859346.1 transporter family protein [Methanococcus maripaludis]MBA2867980.1 transporter family protein [Methanococcus maripaludis]
MEGVILGLLAAVLYGIGTFFAKVVSNEDPYLQWIIVNIVGIVLCVILFGGKCRHLLDYPNKVLIYGAIAAVLVILGTLALYYGLNRGKASVVVPLSSIGPAITTILAVIFLKEHLSFTQIAGIVMIVSGVIVLSINS